MARLREPVGGVIDMTDFGVLVTREASRLVAQHERMLITIALPVHDAVVRVRVAGGSPARSARRHLIRREHHSGLERALLLVLLAHEPVGPGCSAHVAGAVDALIDLARPPMRFAHLLFARGALRHLVASNEL